MSPADCEVRAGVKKTKKQMEKEQVIALLKALLEGKQLQVRKSESEPWVDMSTDITKLDINTEENLYRVKPGQKIRPYADFYEFNDAFVSHNKSNLIYVDKEEKTTQVLKVRSMMPYMISLVDRYNDNEICVSYKEMTDCCRWADDGTVCGIVEQEKED